jgi:hypothetical protein
MDMRTGVRATCAYLPTVADIMRCAEEYTTSQKVYSALQITDEAKETAERARIASTLPHGVFINRELQKLQRTLPECEARQTPFVLSPEQKTEAFWNALGAPFIYEKYKRCWDEGVG